MGFFNTTSAVGTANIEDLLQETNLDTYEGMSLMEANYAAIAETEMNWNAIMEAAAETEMSYFAQTGEEYVYTEGSGLGTSIANFFKKIWEKIKSLFKKFMVMLGSLVNNDKDFVKKHRATIVANIKNIPSDAEYKGFKYTTEKLEKQITSAADNLAININHIKGLELTPIFGVKVDDSDNYDSTDAMDKVRATLLSEGSKSFSDSEMREEAYKIARDGEDSKDDFKLDGTVVQQALSALEDGKKAKDKAKKLYSEVEKKWKSILKDAEKMETEALKKKEGENGYMTPGTLKQFNRALTLCKNAANCIQTLCTVNLTAVKEEYTQCKKICVKVVTYRGKFNEGATVEHFTEGAFGKISLI